MNSLKFTDFSQVDMNFFMTLCGLLKNKDTCKIDFSFDVLRKLSGYKKSNSVNQFVNDLKKMNEKLMHVTCNLETKTEIVMFVLFPTFRIDIENQLLTVSINKDFKFILNELTKNFTRFDLQEFINLSSKYAKILYHLLKQYRSTGHYEVPVEKLRELTGCPEGYSNKQFMQNIILPSVKNLQNCFQNLRCETKYAHRRGKPVSGYIFTFTPEITENRNCSVQETEQQSVQRDAYAAGIRGCRQRVYDYEKLEKELLSRSRAAGLANPCSEKDLPGMGS